MLHISGQISTIPKPELFGVLFFFLAFKQVGIANKIYNEFQQQLKRNQTCKKKVLEFIRS